MLQLQLKYWSSGREDRGKENERKKGEVGWF
jgi:hypothetical protein